jgi:hypothetical protein
VIEPKFLLLDEPFSGIDPIQVLELQRIIFDLKRTGIGILVTDLLVEHFGDLVNVTYTARMEEELDEIEDLENVLKEKHDKDFIDLAKKELEELKVRKTDLEDKLKAALTEEDEYAGRDVRIAEGDLTQEIGVTSQDEDWAVGSVGEYDAYEDGGDGRPIGGDVSGVVGSGLRTGGPGEAVANPVGRTKHPELIQRCADDVPVAVRPFDVERAQRMNRHQVRKMSVGSDEPLGGHEPLGGLSGHVLAVGVDNQEAELLLPHARGRKDLHEVALAHPGRGKDAHVLRHDLCMEGDLHIPENLLP